MEKEIYTPELIEETRHELIVLRNEILEKQGPSFAIALTYAIGMLDTLHHYETNFQSRE